MIPKSKQHHSIRGETAAIALVALITAGCASTPITGSSAPVREVVPNDFARTSLPAAAAPAVATSSTSNQDKVYAIEAITPSGLGVSEIAIEVGAPTLTESAGPSTAMGGPVLVDAKVGEINGMPIVASAFLESLEPRLVALAVNDGLSLTQWRQQATRLIADKLILLVSDELLKAEALADIGPERKKQLVRWEEYLRQRELSRHYGSATIAENDLGQPVDDAVQAQLDQELIRMSLQRDLGSVQVTWHDIQLAYEQQHERFNPPPRAYFHLIKALDGDTKNADLIASKLDAGEAFEDVSKLPETGFQMFQDVEIKGEYEQAALFGIEALNQAAHTLEVDNWTGPIIDDQDLYFLKLLKIEDKSVSLYDAQLELIREITERRQREVRIRRITDLKTGLTTKNEQRIGKRLLDIAQQRFYPDPS